MFILTIQIVEPALGTKLTTMLTTFTTLVGFVSVFYEMKRAADIDECNFVLETYKHFTSDQTKGITIVSQKLDLLVFLLQI